MSALTKAEIITLFLASGGLILSSLAIGWNIFRDVLDKGKLKISCFVGIYTGDPNGGKKIVCNITNIGRKPITATKFMIAYKREKIITLKRWYRSCPPAFVVPRELPKTLEPTEYIVEMANITPEDKIIKHLCVIDTIGKYYKSNRKDEKEIRQKIKEIYKSNEGIH